MGKILVLNGPNINLLGQREPQHYGNTNLEQMIKQLTKMAEQNDHELEHMQSNAEYQLIDKIHAASKEGVDVILLNAGGLTHTSISLRDALMGVKMPFIEIHLSNVHNREGFRKHSFLSDIAMGTISGLGPLSYELGLQAAHIFINQPKATHH